jgi:glycosyltransferase involved in cell wall biosynthesis
LARLQLTPGRYFLYPANFWKHKNHEMLLVAMGLFTTRFRHSDLKLVCTGAPGERRDFVQSAAERMGLRERLVLPGYLSESDFSALMQSCLALIFPSLYEGFGMPVIEAQSIGKPVLCSNLASLPEVAGEAALVFDPRLPESIVTAMQRIESDLTVRQDLIRNGFKNVKRFADADAMASQYLTTLAEVIQGASSPRRELRHD